MKPKAAALLLFLSLFAPAFGAELSPVAQKEIDFLLSRLQQSDCEFSRNDSWHNAKDAHAHIRTKYEYLLHRDMLSSAEDFIIGAASQSSLSKRPYLVRCPGKPVVESGIWLNNTLQQHRKSAR